MMVVVMQGIIIPTHAPHAGSDLRSQALMVHLGNFNPRPPMREATTIPLKMMPASLHFNPRLPCGRRRRTFCGVPSPLSISIPASHARSDGVRARCGTG